MPEESIPKNGKLSRNNELDIIDKEIIKMRLSNPGITAAEMSRRLSKHPNTIEKRLKNPMLQDTIKKAQQSALDILLEAQPAAARRLKREILNEDSDIAIKACREVLKGVLSENMVIKTEKNDLIEFLETLDNEAIEKIVNDNK